ncbi:MAG: cell division protein FtsW [Spirochaetales bacterium]|nr:cell division protein FtsW [Spirochaetales bacterium]
MPFDVERAPRPARGDAQILAAIFLLAGTGIAALYSASYGYAQALGKAPEHFVMRQAVFALAALFVFLVSARVPLAWLRSAGAVITIAGLVLLALPFIPGIGVRRNGASRWFQVAGQTFQPSEAWKLISILYLAHIFDKKSGRMGDTVNAALPPLLVIALGTGLVYAQNDFSTAVLVGVSALAVFWAAGTPARFFAALASIAAPLAALSVLTSDFRLKRILSFVFPTHQSESIGYQVAASTRAIASGGFLGKGIGLGTLKSSSVPEIHSDFIVAALGEEAGFLGVLALAALWTWFAWRGFRVAFRSTGRYESLLSFGLTASLALQALVNVAVASGSVPATGVPLPFFSAGGSSLLASACAAGLLYNLSRCVAALPEEGNATSGVPSFDLDTEAFRG